MIALRPCADVERNLLTLGEGFEAFSLDIGVMDKEIFAAALRGDEAEPLAVIEPFDGSCLFGHDVLLIVCGSI